MRIISKENLDQLLPYALKDEPIADEVSVHKLSTMIAHKTKFRVSDVEEVIKEIGPALCSLLIQRKTMNFGGVKIRNRWVPYEEPKYIRNGDGYWTFGYFMPKVEFNKDARLMYSGRSGGFSEDFVDSLLPYMPDEIKNEDDIVKLSYDLMEATGQLGKGVIVDEEGYIVQKNPKKKRRYFDETFHPTYAERMNFIIAQRSAYKEYNERTKAGEGLGPASLFVIQKMKDNGFKLGADIGGDSDELPEES